MNDSTPHAVLLRHEHVGRTNGRGWTAMECPECGEHRQYKAAFNDKVFKCFVCGACYGLTTLAKKLNVDAALPRRERRVLIPKPPKPRWWHKEPEKWSKLTLAHPQRVQLWQAYRPFTLDSIARYRLGAGVVPATPCRHPRRTYVYQDGDRPTLRGRLIDCDCDPKSLKWVTAGGGSAALWGVELLEPGATVVVCESPVDAMLAMQTDPDLVAVAGTAGAGTWREDWTRAIADSDPALVIVAYDNDLQGQAQGETRQVLATAWLKKHKKLPVANGPKVTNKLLKAGALVRLFDWENHPPKADIGWLLTG